MKNDSLLAKHNRILGFDPGLKLGDREEQTHIEQLRLPSLNLPASPAGDLRFGPKITGGKRRPVVALALAACLSLIAFAALYHQKDNDLRIKGNHHISVFWERDGVVHPWKGETPLAAGDRIRAEVLASQAVFAYAVITNEGGTLLSSPEQALAGAQKVSAGERRAFPGSFKLVGPAEGETLVVVICEEETLGRGLIDQASARPETVLVRNLLPKGCDLQRFPLR